MRARQWILGIWALAMWTLLILTIFVGCAFRASLHPAKVQWLFLYGRQTDCPGEPIPPQLIPQARALPPIPLVAEAEPPPCTTMEVGAKSYQDSLTAIGTILVAALGAVGAAAF